MTDAGADPPRDPVRRGGGGEDADADESGGKGGFAAYSTEYRPRRLYSRGRAGAIDAGLVETVVGFGDRPLDFYADLGSGHLLWSFKGVRHTKSARTGYFVAAYRGDRPLFSGFETELERLQATDRWSIEYTGDARWDIGLDLARVPAELPGSTQVTFGSLVERLRYREADAPLEFGMRTHGTAMQVVKALAERGTDCTVAIGTGGDGTTLPEVDLLLRPGAASDFEPRLDDAGAATDADRATDERRPSGSGSGPESASESASESQRGRPDSWGFASRVAGAVVLVCFGFAAYSFVSSAAVRPITGLATIGGAVGGALALAVGQAIRAGGPPANALGAVRDGVRSERDRWLVVFGYGTLLGFLFPRLAWEVGQLLGRDGFLFGPVTNVANASLSVSAYVLVHVVLTTGFVVGRRVWRERDRERHRSPNDPLPLTAVVVGHVLYALCLFVATGFAGSLWFRIIPSATV